MNGKQTNRFLFQTMNQFIRDDFVRTFSPENVLKNGRRICSKNNLSAHPNLSTAGVIVYPLSHPPLQNPLGKQ